jgi:hypothetical protein
MHAAHADEKKRLERPHAGAHYSAVLASLHEWLSPRGYLEIGVNTGSTFKLSSCSSIGVDPKFLINQDVVSNKEISLFFQMTSDRFFAT